MELKTNVKKLLIPLTLGCALLLIPVSIALAYTSGPPTHDSYIDSVTSGIPHDDQDLGVAGSTSNCNPTNITYLQWDLSGIPDTETIASATLTLTTTYANNPTNATLTLYETGDGWTETGLTWNNAPALGSSIETVAGPTAAGQTVTFNSAALASYLDGEASGDNVASLAIQWTGTCHSLITLAVFEDRESGADGPYLLLQNPTAVNLVSFRATRPSPNTAISVFLGGIGIVLMGMVAIMWRKRS